jgi:hypothetical protein
VSDRAGWSSALQAIVRILDCIEGARRVLRGISFGLGSRVVESGFARLEQQCRGRRPGSSALRVWGWGGFRIPPSPFFLGRNALSRVRRSKRSLPD